VALTLDHLVIAVRELDVAAANYERLLGRKRSWRGRHPTYGTANVLFRLDNCYVELLAPDGGGSDSPWARALREHLDTRGEGVYAIAMGTDDIEATVARARTGGLDVTDPAAGAGVDLDTGARRAWRNARIDPKTARGIVAFFIQHDSPADALPAVAPHADGSSALGVDHTVVASSDLDATLRIWRDAIGLDLRRTLDSPNGRRLQFLRLGESILELAGAAEPKERGQRDALWGISYRVGSVAKAVERLRSEGVTVSDVRQGNAPNTLVADLKHGFSHDVRTLLIEKDVA
jgi:catechol 2,3-dioxygenase-like lactoylglutathione lyase family enzyme